MMLSKEVTQQDPLSRVVVVLQELASIYRRTGALGERGWSGGSGWEQGAQTDEANCVRRAIEAVGRSAAARIKGNIRATFGFENR